MGKISTYDAELKDYNIKFLYHTDMCFLSLSRNQTVAILIKIKYSKVCFGKLECICRKYCIEEIWAKEQTLND